MAERRPALGKGLSALIPDAPDPDVHGTVEVDIQSLAPNDDQPRGQMDETRLEDLTRSIRASGIIQPIVVRRVDSGYRIIAGERRWRAAQRAGLTRVPVVVREVTNGSRQELLQLALIENIQREDLNCVDEATAYRRLADEFQLTQDQIASSVGKERSTVANYLRLLRLPDEILADLSAGTLSMGHARALLSLTEPATQREVAREIVGKGLSVRDAEAMVRKMLSPIPPRPAPPEDSPPDVHTKAAEDRLRFVLGTRVRIARRGHGGTVEIRFTSEAELNRIYEQITEKPQS